MKTIIGSSTINFILWITKNTTVVQSNIRSHKGLYYFMDRKNHTPKEEDSIEGGGIVELWDIYFNEMVGS